MEAGHGRARPPAKHRTVSRSRRCLKDSMWSGSAGDQTCSIIIQADSVSHAKKDGTRQGKTGLSRKEAKSDESVFSAPFVSYRGSEHGA